MAFFHDRWPWRKTADGRTLLDVLPRWLRFGLGVLLLAVAGACMMFRSVDHDPARWHVDPLATERTGKPNDYLVAPEGAAAAPVDRVFEPADTTPAALMAAFHRVATEAPRTSVVAGSPEDRFVTYVQHSAFWGFPDYVSVRAVEADGGAGLAVWSRARYGHSDLGVNAARIEDWLSRLDP